MNSNARSPWPAPTTTDFLPTVDPVNNWKPGGHCPPYELFREAEAFAFLGANDGVHNESLNLESAAGGESILIR